METIDTWKQKQRSDSLFTLREGDNPLLKFIDKAGPGNRINSALQGWIFTALRMTAEGMKWPWLGTMVDHLEDYQTTCTDPHGSKEMLLEAIQFDRLAAHDRGKTSLSLSTDQVKNK
jgi:hypothetical protein